MSLSSFIQKGPDSGGSSNIGRADYAEYKAIGKGLASSARVTPDGRIVISLDLKNKLPDLPPDYAADVEEFAVEDTAAKWRDCPSLNIVIMIVGSRGTSFSS